MRASGQGQGRALVARDVTDRQLLHFAGEPFNRLKGKKSLVRIDKNLHKLTSYSSFWLSGLHWDMIESKRYLLVSELRSGPSVSPEAILLHRKRFFLYGFFSDLHKKEAVEKMN
jgi:hypothetical protein